MKTKPYYKYNDFSLYHGNSLEILAEIQENSVDMIFADPPYLFYQMVVLLARMAKWLA